MLLPCFAAHCRPANGIAFTFIDIDIQLAPWFQCVLSVTQYQIADLRFLDDVQDVVNRCGIGLTVTDLADGFIVVIVRSVIRIIDNPIHIMHGGHVFNRVIELAAANIRIDCAAFPTALFLDDADSRRILVRVNGGLG